MQDEVINGDKCGKQTVDLSIERRGRSSVLRSAEIFGFTHRYLYRRERIREDYAACQHIPQICSFLCHCYGRSGPASRYSADVCQCRCSCSDMSSP